MTDASKIEWNKNPDGTPGRTWPAIRGCERISPGCGGGPAGPRGKGGCYAEAIAARFSWAPDAASEREAFHKAGTYHGFAERTEAGPRWTGKVELWQAHLLDPVRTRKPTTWFISMSDWCHKKLSDVDRDAIMAVVVATSDEQTYQMLTKRGDILQRYMRRLNNDPSVLIAAAERHGIPLTPALRRFADGKTKRLQRLWLGVSVEMAPYKIRLDNLRHIDLPGVRFASFEPLLGSLGELDLSGLDLVIAGAESGHFRRDMEMAWVREIRDQAIAQGVKLFFKQAFEGRRKVSLPLLDGKQWAEMPEPQGDEEETT